MVDQHKPELIPVQFKLEYTQKKLAGKGVFWHFQKFKTISKKPAANGAFQIIDNSRKYRIKQNNDYTANKPSFHAVFQDAAQPLYKRFSIRVTSQFVFDQAL